jgi:endonuclease/exonuclease/phosphatase family metal-dependent hydrolase
MTYNIGGGRRRYISDENLILQIIQEVSPDILVIQEAVQIRDADGKWHRNLDAIADTISIDAAQVFSPTLTMHQHMHPANKNMVDALFQDHQDWQQGNAIVSRWAFHALGNPKQEGTPRSIPLHHSPTYEGSRDTEPRAAIITRIGREPHCPIVVGLHLSTLLGERGKDIIAGKPEHAAQMREEEVRHVISLLHDDVLDKNELVFVMGDFNATVDEACIRYLVDAGNFVAATPDSGLVSTHPKVEEAIDHLFLFPRNRIVDYKSYVVDTRAAHEASDHLPIVAEVTVK